MKKIIYAFLFLVSCIVQAQVTTTPSPFEATQSVTINFDKTGTPLASYTGTIYAHIGVTVNGTNWQYVKGAWGNNTTQPAMTLVSGNVYKLDIAPDLYTYFGAPTTSSITKICVVFRNAAGTAQTSDIFINVGAFQATLSAPVANSTTFLTSGSNFTVSASNTNGSANYTLLANGSFVTGYTGSTFSYTHTNITSNKYYTLTVTMGSVTFTYKFIVIVNPTVVSAGLPSSTLEDGINYDTSDATKATLVLTAPGKEFVYVAGSFNNYQPGNTHSMKQDPTTGKFWLELTGLTSGTVYTYQYWVGDQTPNTAQGSPKLVKTGDPYSTLVLSPFDDPWIPATSYPNIPTYPSGQEREVTVLQTGQTPYAWSSATTGFVKPSKDNLVVYEALVRDFNSNRTYQDLIDKIDYLKNLKINAIELMPVMEYEGDEGWGYNPCFHLALDKFYGPATKLKEFIDLCHQNGIAVILDVALNHAFGRNPMVRMWMKDSDGDGWGDPANDNPYFNEYAKHSYGVGADFNHTSAYTKYYTKRVIKQWVQEFKIDGFRWDLTKGFTQSCGSGDDTCTNGYLQDRVDILKEYADYSWSLDPTHYVIFEHLGQDGEEQQWANYRINETPSKGVMMWGEMNAQYGQLAMGYNSSADITRMGASSRGFTAKRLLGYAESHDKDRMGNLANAYGVSSVAGNATNVLTRMGSIAATSILVPGPKMIYQFEELGSTQSIFTCTDGSINTDTDATAGDCKLATKPQPQWTTWYGDAQRQTVYSTYSKLIDLKRNNAVFSANHAISPNGSLLLPRIYIWDDTIPATQLKNVVVLANFNTTATNVTPDFPYTGTWVNLMDNSTLNVTNTTTPINIEAGGFRVYGNQAALATNNQGFDSMIALYPNPANNYFSVNKDLATVEIYTITGQLVKTVKNIYTDTAISIEDMPQGVYMVKCIDENQANKTFKLIKR